MRSQIREILVLQDLAKEVESGILQTAALLQAATLPVVDPNVRKKVFTTASSLLENAELLGKLCSTESEEIKRLTVLNNPTTQDQIKAFYMLKESGLADILHRALE